MMSTHSGTVRKTWVGDNVVLTRVVVKANSTGKPHSHGAEQVSMILRGGVKVTMDGAQRIARAGSIVHIPADAVHMFEILEEETEILDVYSIEAGAEQLRKHYPGLIGTVFEGKARRATSAVCAGSSPRRRARGSRRTIASNAGYASHSSSISFSGRSRPAARAISRISSRVEGRNVVSVCAAGFG